MIKEKHCGCFCMVGPVGFGGEWWGYNWSPRFCATCQNVHVSHSHSSLSNPAENFPMPLIGLRVSSRQFQAPRYHHWLQCLWDPKLFPWPSLSGNRFGHHTSPPTWCHSTQSHQAMNLMVNPPCACREIFHSLVILEKLHSPTQIIYLDHSPEPSMVMTTFWFIYTSRKSTDTTKYLAFHSLLWILSFPTTFLSPCSTSRPLILPNRFRSVTSQEHMIVEILQWLDWVVVRTL